MFHRISCVTAAGLLAVIVVLAATAQLTAQVSADDSGIAVVSSVEGQPLAANIQRLIEALEFLGFPLPEGTVNALEVSGRDRDASALQRAIDRHVLLTVSLNPEVRVKVGRGPATATIQQGGYTPVLVKIFNDSTVTRRLRIVSPQSGPVYAGASEHILKRQVQTELNDNENKHQATDRFLDVEMFQSPPMTSNLSGLPVEYAIALIYSHEAGRREATIGFDVGAGTQDLGFRGETPVLWDVRPAIPTRLAINDYDGQPTTARLIIRDANGHVYPPQAKRLAPDFFFQPQIYRSDGDVVLLPPGTFTVQSCRGPEYRIVEQSVAIDDTDSASIPVKLERWVNPADFGFYCGDHHIHGAGCSHYESPTKGVRPEDMFLQVKGEGLNVGCVLTWGPCFEFQRQFFSPAADDVSEPLTLIKYDLEISGFGSAALGHVCLLNLRDQTYPGSEGSKLKGWPTWTVPVLRWAKLQGGVTGYPHSAMHVDAVSSTKWLIEQHDVDTDGELSLAEAASVLLPYAFDTIDEDGTGRLTRSELQSHIDRAADELPNLALPSMNGGGAMEICVSTAEGVCDFISAMDTARIPEWNTWYHLMNCGFPLKLSGETDFPCMSSRRVGQGRVYVRLGAVDRLDFGDWCRGLADGQSYVSDGFAHALEFTVNEQRPGTTPVRLSQAGTVHVTATVAFAPETPRAVAYGQLVPPEGRRMVGDTVNLHAPRSDDSVRGGESLVELVVNGRPIASRNVPADGNPHDLAFDVPIARSSWVALRHFPQMHTNPVDVIVADKPVRTSRNSARWCEAAIQLLWNNRSHVIAEHERESALETYERSMATYRRIAAECDVD